jgi:hypothetical protein
VDYLPSDPGGPGDDIGAKYPSLAAAADGTLHVFWHDYRVAGIANVEIYTKSRPPGGAWDPSREADVRLTTTAHTEVPGDNGYVPVPVATPDGGVRVLWYDFRWDGAAAEICAKARPAGGAWDLTPGDGADVRLTNDTANSELVDVAAAADGRVIAVWRSVEGGARVRWAERSPGPGTWSSPGFVDGNATVAGAPCVGVDAAGRAHVIWPDSRDGGRALWTRVRDANGTWSAEQRLTRPAEGADNPSLDAAEDGTLHLVWDDGRISLFNREVFHRELAPATAWDTTGASDFRISVGAGGSARPSVRAAGGVVLVTWRDERDGNRELYARRRSSAATDVTPTPARLILTVAPNPTSGAVWIRRAAAAPAAHGIVFVRNASGRVLRRLTGGAQLTWDGRDDSGRPAAAGTYFVSDVATGSTARIVVLR